MNPFKKTNIFSCLTVIAVFVFMFRLLDLSGFSIQSSIAQDTAAPQQFENVEPPPMPSKDAPAETAVVEAAAEKSAPAAMAEGAPPVASPYGEPSFSASEIETLQSLAKRRDELDKRERTIVQHEALLKAAGSEVDKKIAELNKIRGELEALLGKQKTAEEEQINSLVKIYENMKPKEAARIFDTLEMDVLLSVIGKMSERKVSPVLAGMDPEKARQVTIQLAERRKLPSLATEQAKKPASAPVTTPTPTPAPVPSPVAQ